ncbi:GGDEF domain-containing phosphodiesterase [Terasakiella sp. SH-1]|uniref:sensor domain-containing protein n=1 Tax=Terasakiella sp. SH-1 TaxID=2560057 RepID=UPI00107335F0|nr:GGDEF domain-containing phosphodiesterase [Terasakiella sp. SH-1]
MISLTEKQTYQISILLIVALALGSLVIGTKAYDDFNRISRSWTTYADDTFHRANHLADLKSALGYGGVIHHFKNYVIRHDEKYYNAARKSAEKAKIAIAELEVHLKTQAEKDALQDIARVLRAYQNMTVMVKAAIAGGRAVTDIDRIVKVDDTPAFEAMEIISRGIEKGIEQGHSELTNAISGGKMVVIVGLVGVFILLFVAGFLLSNLRRLFGEIEKKALYLDSITSGLPCGLLVVNRDGMVEKYNEKTKEIFGAIQCQDKKFSLLDIFGSIGDMPAFLDVLSGNMGQFTIESQDESFSRKPVLVEVQPLNTQGRQKYILTITDMSELNQAKRKLEETNLQLEQTIEEVNGFKKLLDEHALVSMTDAAGRIAYANEKFCKTSGFSLEELLGNKHNLVKSNMHSSVFWKKMWQEISSGKIWHGEVTNRRKDGSLYWVYSTIMPFRNEKGAIHKYVSARTDITEIKNAERRIHQLAYVDTLTKLPNLMQFNELIKSMQAEIDQFDDFGKLVIIDLGVSGLVEINGAFGWEYGDRLICTIAERLKRELSEAELIAKIGGDRFGIVLFTEDHADDYVNQITAKIQKVFHHAFEVDENLLKVSASCGALVYPDDLQALSADKRTTDDINRYLELSRLESSKMSGSTLIRFESGILQNVSRRTMILHSVEQALENGEIYMVYQPQISLKSRDVVGVEALMRWRRPDGSFISPGEFIPVLEVSEFISQLSQWTNERCVQDLKTLQQTLPTVRMGINISANFLVSDYLLPSLEKLLKDHKIDPACLELEVTESSIMEDLDLALGQLNKLKSLGFRISVDDFGTGHSSLAYLAKFPLDQLKVDKSFIRFISENDQSRAIVKTVISLGKAMNLDVIAEGTEKKEQIDFLQAEGCDEVQGYYFAKPMELHELVKWCENPPLHDL